MRWLQKPHYPEPWINAICETRPVRAGHARVRLPVRIGTRCNGAQPLIVIEVEIAENPTAKGSRESYSWCHLTWVAKTDRVSM